MTARDVFALASTDPDAQALVEETLSEILFSVTNLTIAFDPERIAVGGELMGSANLILPRLQTHLRRFAPFPPTVVTASVVHDAGLMGAVALALEVLG
jgi:glucokinase